MLEWQQHLIDPAFYAPNWIAYAHVFALVCFFILGWFVAIVERFTWFSRVYLVFCMACVVWQAGRFGLNSATDDAMRAYYGALGYAAALIVIVGAFHLILNGLQRHHAYASALLVSWVFAALATPLVLVTPWFFSTLTKLPWGYEPLLTPIGYTIPLFAVSLALIVIIDVVIQLPRSDVTISYLRRRRMIVAAALLLIPAASDFLPSVGIPAWPLSSPFILLFAIFIAIIVLRNRWLDVNVDISAVSLLGRSSEASLLTDKDGVIQYANAKAGELLGVKLASSLVGKSLDTWLGEYGRGAAMQMAAQSGLALSLEESQFPDGAEKYVTVSYLDERSLSLFVQIHQRNLALKRGKDIQVDRVSVDRKDFIFECKRQCRNTVDALGMLALGCRELHQRSIDLGLTEAEEMQRVFLKRAEYQFQDCLVFGCIQNTVYVLAEAAMLRDQKELERRLYRLVNAHDELDKFVDVSVYASVVLNVDFESFDQTIDELYFDIFDKANLDRVKVRQSIRSPEKNIRISENAVIRAIEDRSFEFFLQPVVDADEEMIVGFEALVRMKNDDGVYTVPTPFIEHLESGPTALRFEKWALEDARRILEGFERVGRPDLWLSVNLSTLDPHVSGIVDLLDEIFSDHPEMMRRLCVEITERSAVREENDRLYSQLQQRGVAIAIDDFGTSQSSLSRLISLPLNKLKIDRSFVRQLEVRQEAHALVKHISRLAEDLDLAVIAEGVESEAEKAVLQVYGVRYFQGFLYSQARPVSYWMSSGLDVPLRAHSSIQIRDLNK